MRSSEARTPTMRRGGRIPPEAGPGATLQDMTRPALARTAARDGALAAGPEDVIDLTTPGPIACQFDV
eukprot:851159-Prymnesium_polylepis.1